MDKERVSRRTLPTAAFTLTVSMLAWIEQESARRGISKSEVVRELVTAAMARPSESAPNQVAA